jgi:hypothetical protein
MAFRDYFLLLLKPLGLLLQLNRSVTEFDEFRAVLVLNSSVISFILNGLPGCNVLRPCCTLSRILLRGEYGSGYFIQKRKKDGRSELGWESDVVLHGRSFASRVVDAGKLFLDCYPSTAIP